MELNLTKFDPSAALILTTLAAHFPKACQIGFADLFPEEQADISKREAHIGVIALLKHENYITHEIGSAAAFILTRDGLALFGMDIEQHLKAQLLLS